MESKRRARDDQVEEIPGSKNRIYHRQFSRGVARDPGKHEKIDDLHAAEQAMRFAVIIYSIRNVTIEIVGIMKPQLEG